MANYQVRFHPKAIEEAENSIDWYSQRSLIAASGFIKELSHAIDMISEAPFRCPIFNSSSHRYVLPRYPFSVIYRVKKEVIEVLAIAHHKKRPGYWTGR